MPLSPTPDLAGGSTNIFADFLCARHVPTMTMIGDLLEPVSAFWQLRLSRASRAGHVPALMVGGIDR
jgi:hypothetical protein